MKSDHVKAVLMLAAVGGVGYLAWKAYKTGAGIVDAAKQAVEQGAATVQSAWRNTVAGPYEQGRQWAETGEVPYVSSKAWLYSDHQYTGVDPATGLLVTDGEWYGNAEARRYTAEQNDRGAAPPATSVNGAAFGIYPSVFNSRRISDAAANDARRVFAATDPRRLDL